MLCPYKSQLDSLRIVLASASERRKEILSQMGVKKFRIMPSTFKEDLDKSKFPMKSKYAEETAKAKALGVYKMDGDVDLVIGADTVVLCCDKILEKPKDKADATRMLMSLSGKTAVVCSGLALVSSKGCESCFVETEVDFRSFDEETAKAYAETGEPLGKAGAFAIQGIGGSLVERIRGDYYNVVGLPMSKTSSLLVQYLAHLD